jgi:hypothetical protein
MADSLPVALCWADAGVLLLLLLLLLLLSMLHQVWHQPCGCGSGQRCRQAHCAGH